MEDNVEYGGAVEAIAHGRDSASDGSDKRRGELGMSSWMKSGFSEPITMESSLWDPEALGLRIQVIRGCRRGLASFQFQNLVPIPRNIREATRSRTRVPAPRVIMMMTLMIKI